MGHTVVHRRQGDALHIDGEAGGGMLEGLSPPDAKHTRHLEHAKFRSKKHRKDGGKGTQ